MPLYGLLLAPKGFIHLFVIWLELTSVPNNVNISISSAVLLILYGEKCNIYNIKYSLESHLVSLLY
jgi:hypothetical protein